MIYKPVCSVSRLQLLYWLNLVIHLDVIGSEEPIKLLELMALIILPVGACTKSWPTYTMSTYQESFQKY